MSKQRVKQLIRFGIVKNKTSITRIAKEALNNQLYVSGWSFQSWLKDVKHIKRIVTCRNKGELIAIGIRYKHIKYFNIKCLPNAGIFVKHSYRNNGIGSKIIKKLPVEGMPLKLASGVNGSYQWYEKHKKEMKFKLLW